MRPWPFRVTIKERQGDNAISAEAGVDVPPLDLGMAADYARGGDDVGPSGTSRHEPPTQVDIHAVKALDVDLDDEILR